MAMAAAGANFDIGRVIQRTFGLVGRNFVPFFILAFVLSGIPAIIIAYLQPRDPAVIQESPGTYFTMIIIGALVSMVTGVVLQGALTRASIDDLSGKGVQLGSAVNSTVPLILPLVGLGILWGLGVGFAALLLLIPGIILALCWAVSAPVMVVERLGISASMSRSMQLTKNHRWAILGLAVLFFIGYMIALMVFVTVIGAGSFVGMAAGGQLDILPLIVMVVIGVVASLIGTVGAAAIYFELREIKDGVDVTQLARVFE